MKIICVIPTLNAGHELLVLVEAINRQTIASIIHVVDSSSSDGSINSILNLVDNVSFINLNDFNHGGTRQQVVEQYPDADFFIFLTQDIVLEDDNAFSTLIEPFYNSNVGAVYGRQLPKDDADLFAIHSRLFNYKSEGHVNDLSSSSVRGIKTVFMSNSFAAYRNEAIISAGGFSRELILGEDMFIAAKMILNNWVTVYKCDSICRHSHNYSIRQEAMRYFDIGVFHAQNPWLLNHFGLISGEGFKFVVSELKFLGVYFWYLFPLCLLRNFLKLVFYKLGLYHMYIPVRFKVNLSMHKRYWSAN